MANWGSASLFVNALELGVLIWLLIHLRHSAAPHQAALIEQQRRELDMVRHNVGRMSTEHLENRNAMLEADSRIWEELRRINARLDIMHCPISNPECPLNHREG